MRGAEVHASFGNRGPSAATVANAFGKAVFIKCLCCDSALHARPLEWEGLLKKHISLIACLSTAFVSGCWDTLWAYFHGKSISSSMGFRSSTWSAGVSTWVRTYSGWSPGTWQAPCSRPSRAKARIRLSPSTNMLITWDPKWIFTCIHVLTYLHNITKHNITLHNITLHYKTLHIHNIAKKRKIHTITK